MMLVFLLIFFPPVFAKIYTDESIQTKQEKYDRYVECINKKNSANLKINNKTISQRFFKSISFLEDSSIKIRCFVCIAPDEEDEVEEIWKPNDSFIGRSVKFLKNKIKEALQKLQGTKEDEPMKTTFEWEFMPLGKGQSWRPVMDLKEPMVPSARTRKVVDSFTMKSDATKEIGNHFELEIFRANHSKNSGFYRCTRKNKKFAKIEQLYFVDVLTEIAAEVRKFEEKEDPEVIERFDYGVEAIWEKTPWGPCDRLYVNESNRTLEWIGWIQIIIRYFTGLFISILVTRIVLKTKINIDYRAHERASNTVDATEDQSSEM
ncbi:hypothetical protein FO519_004617 [Halicephalobus sp. NKZ332]|nr:hypothetical protein FO519_004617 [Halicephalobus sp. NKZ332]